MTLTLRDAQGAAVQSAVQQVPAGEQRLLLVSELSPAPPAGFYGMLEASADAPIDAVGFTRIINDRGEEVLAGLPVLTTPTEPPDAPHRYVYAVDGDTWASEWWLLSQQAQPLQTTLDFTDAAGSERFLPMEEPGTP